MYTTAQKNEEEKKKILLWGFKQTKNKLVGDEKPLIKEVEKPKNKLLTDEQQQEIHYDKNDKSEMQKKMLILSINI
jgi:hypothetical protein